MSQPNFTDEQVKRARDIVFSYPQYVKEDTHILATLLQEEYPAISLQDCSKLIQKVLFIY